jgi:hypothetical protein
LNRTDRGADKFNHFAADRFHHPAYLAITAFAHADFDVRVLAGIAHAFHFRGASGAIAELDSFA